MPTADPDPDRFLDYGTPGAQEWWYFDALSADGRDALVIVWYAGLPFDPAYGVGTLKHLRQPARYPAPRALDHSAIGVSWYRDGKTIAYALNGYRSGDFRYEASPLSIRIAGCTLDRDDRGYRLQLETPAVDGRSTIRADLRFDPAPDTASMESDLGTSAHPHLWILAAADCRVSGRMSIEGRSSGSTDFIGRGYHDHNAGSEEISRAMRRWRWGRVHVGDRTYIYYQAEPRWESARGLLIVCDKGRPVDNPESGGHTLVVADTPRRNVFGVVDAGRLSVDDGHYRVSRTLKDRLDDGPFYLRWTADFDVDGTGALGICEHLETRNLNSRWFNWMIPYRLKRPNG